MKYSVIKVVNGNFAIVSEHGDLQGALVKFHDVCKVHWNADDVEKAMIAVIDENLDVVQDHKEFIYHIKEEPVVEEPVVEETSEEA